MKPMKIMVYCQHVLGVGHFFRILEILRAMPDDDLILITGGDGLDIPLPTHVRHVRLPGLMMDDRFSGLYSVDPEKQLDIVKEERRDLLLDLLEKEAPDCFLVELYPFGRRAFRFELVPGLEYIRSSLPSCKVVCSIRDILVERKKVQKYESGVIQSLNTYFDGVLVHADPDLIRFDQTFSRIDEFKVPLFYTGFIGPKPDNHTIKTRYTSFRSTEDSKLVIASVGGGSVGADLLKAIGQSIPYLKHENIDLRMYTGPYMKPKDIEYLKSFQNQRVHVRQFEDDFVSLLAAADLSISMAGYNTCMNIVAAGVPSLVWPFGQNREQRMRASHLGRTIPMRILEDEHLVPETLSGRIIEMIKLKKSAGASKINIQGGPHSARMIKEIITH